MSFQRKISTSFLSAAIVPFLSLITVLLSYYPFITLIRSLDAVVASLFGTIYGMFILWGGNLTVFAIHYALVFGIYMWWDQ